MLNPLSAQHEIPALPENNGTARLCGQVPDLGRALLLPAIVFAALADASAAAQAPV